MKKYIPQLLFYIIILSGFLLRVTGYNWDAGFHMHPDERAIVLAVSDLSYPGSLSQFLSPDSPLNPKFFAYGSFPFYLLRVFGDIFSIIDSEFGEYSKINLIGRVISALFDTGTIIVLYFLGKHLRDRNLGLIVSALYAISVLPIQLSHFYAVDTILTFFITLTLLFLLKLYEKPTFIKSFVIGIFLGLSLATKISATVILSSVVLTLCLDFLLIFLKSPHRVSEWKGHLTPLIKKLFVYGIVVFSTSLFIFSLAQPYALIDAQLFLRQIQEQSHMTKDAFTFPYTLQYVGKIPYIYEIKNIFLFGLGPMLGSVSVIGFFYCLYRTVKTYESFPWQKMLILLQFFITYFLITGSFAIGFMRYMLPIYPLLIIFSGLTLYDIFKRYTPHKSLISLGISILVLILILIWPVSFMHIYFKPNTKVIASEWIHTNIPEGSVLATEHWDDTLPLTDQYKYDMRSLPLYEPDIKQKWDEINQTLSQTDYIIVASNRLYVPLMKLTDCSNLPAHRCYLRTSLYYKELFEETSGFKKIAEFTSFPTIPFTSISFNDQSADESFTVYDHPKIMIFQKIDD